tara:strand:+ start:705 stop:980 length:276 start_codon:yes stop_codon:yes gene_type:complete
MWRLNNMQLVSNFGSIVIDYYPVKSIFTHNIIPNLNLKVVSNKGKTLYKLLLDDIATGDDIIRRNDSGKYNITINTKRCPQYVNPNEKEVL